MGQVAIESPLTKTVIASADLSTKQYYFVAVNSSAQVAVASTAGQYCDGVLMDKPAAAGRPGLMAIAGSTVPVVAGGSITMGDLVTCDSTGKAVTLTPPSYVDTQAGSATDPLLGKYSLGRALTSAASGEQVKVLLTAPTPTLTPA